MKSFSTLGIQLLQTSASAFQSRFFSRFAASSSSVRLMTEQPLSEKIRQLTLFKEQQERYLQKKYPHMLAHTFHQKIMYSLRSETPQEMIAGGGLYTSSSALTDLSWNIDSGNNTGMVCFSLLPEVSVIFRSKKISAENPRSYLYAFPLEGRFWLPGGPWRQVCSPGAFPITPWWRAREVLDVHDSRVELGPLVGQGNPHPHTCQRFESYLRNTLHAPMLLNVADEDYPEMYEIIDTPETAEFQKEVTEHYQKKSTFGARPA